MNHDPAFAVQWSNEASSGALDRWDRDHDPPQRLLARGSP